jgi:PAS domain S-box-containing protein
MNRKPNTARPTAQLRGRTEAELQEFGVQPETHPMMAELYRRAEARLRAQSKSRRSKGGLPEAAADPQRLLHELQVHQVELELQNAELQKARDDLEVALENYTDLYDFAPVGYCSIDESGEILEANLTAAAFLGVERSRLINRRLLLFVSPANRPVFLAFLKHVFAGTKDPVCEARLLKEGAEPFWASFRAAPAVSLKGARRWCRVAFGNITARKAAEEAQRRVEAMAVRNRALQEEIARRLAIEKALKETKRHQSQLLAQSRALHEQLRYLSRQVLRAQEEERKRISRELHDVIAQTLTGINLRLAALKKEAARDTKGVDRNIARTQRLVEHAVNIVHQFARELRPAVLDDLGLIPALHSYLKDLNARTGVRTELTAAATVEQLDPARRTVLYRVAQEALTNVARHARAHRVEVILERLPDRVCMSIKDDGKSFDVERVRRAKGNGQLGLLGMRERLEMVGGNLVIESAPGKGTTIQAQIPLRKIRGGGGARRR